MARRSTERTGGEGELIGRSYQTGRRSRQRRAAAAGLEPRIEREQVLRLSDPTQRKAADGREAPLFYCNRFRKGRRDEDRLVHRTAHRRDAGDLIDRRADHCEIEPLLAADVAVEHTPRWRPRYIRSWEALGRASHIERRDRLAGFLCRVERGGTGAGAILGREDRQHPVADQLEDIARMLVDR